MEAIMVTLSSAIFIASVTTVMTLSTVRARGNHPARRHRDGVESG